jgi:hypothetical protein
LDELEEKARQLVGTASYDNWRAFNAKEPPQREYEYLVYTDARLTGGIVDDLGPYAFINLVPWVEKTRRVRAAFVLRWSSHVVFGPPRFDKADSTRYHGGDMTDEIVALASLKCGVRLRAGNLSRLFQIGGDPKGQPVNWNDRAEPALNLPNRGLVLPIVAGEHSIMSVQEMTSFPLLKPEEAIALVRSARLYQDSLWVAESDPHLCWLMLVSAVETAANMWRSSRGSPVERLADSKPDLVEYLNNTGVAELTDRIAKEFADSLGVRRKFSDFLLRHLAPLPTARPPEHVQVDWAPDSLDRAFRKIYEHRSKALHDGITFPAPMCIPPRKYEASWEAVEERPLTRRISMAGATWLDADLPMLLHTFEYIVRYALNAWWREMATAAN